MSSKEASNNTVTIIVAIIGAFATISAAIITYNATKSSITDKMYHDVYALQEQITSMSVEMTRRDADITSSEQIIEDLYYVNGQLLAENEMLQSTIKELQSQLQQAQVNNPVVASEIDINDNLEFSVFTYVDRLTQTGMTRYTGNQGDSFISILGTRNGYVDIDAFSYNHGLEAWLARWNSQSERSWVKARYSLNKPYRYLKGSVVILESYNTTDFDCSLIITGDNGVIGEYKLTPDTLPLNDLLISIEDYSSFGIEISDNKAVAGGTSFGLVNWVVVE